jgi:hypothetical protein
MIGTFLVMTAMVMSAMHYKDDLRMRLRMKVEPADVASRKDTIGSSSFELINIVRR